MSKINKQILPSLEKVMCAQYFAYTCIRGVYFYLFRDIHPGTVYEFLRIPEEFWMTHSMPKTFPEVMNIMLNVNCITKTFLEFQTLTESVYSIHS